MEYQCYEFHSLDQPLSAEARAEIDTWSSRTRATANSAVFTYSYSDLPVNEVDAVEKFFDIMLYRANWGSVRLLMKFPEDAVNYQALKHYDVVGIEGFYDEIELTIYKKNGFVFINFESNPDEGYIEWIDVGGIAPLLSLRDDIINEDYRMLYLSWLHIMERRYTYLEDEEDLLQELLSIKEPNLPDGLKKLSGALQAFADLFFIDDIWVAAAATKSAQAKKVALDIEKMVLDLSEKEKNDFLLRLAKNELRLHQKLVAYLKKKSGHKYEISANNRTIADLVELVEKEEKLRQIAAEKKAEEARKQQLELTAKNQDAYWKEVVEIGSEGRSREYHDALKLLKKLYELAVEENTVDKFKNQLEEIQKSFSTKRSLIKGIKSEFGHL
jgi:hypothetical protein